MTCQVPHPGAPAAAAAHPQFSPFDASSSLPDDLLLRVASYLPAAALTAFQAALQRLFGLGEGVDLLWRHLCELRWHEWPLYRLTPDRLAWLDDNTELSDLNWRGWYYWGERDVQRTTTSPSELEELSWYFNFTPAAGGRGKSTLSRCRFSRRRLFVFKPPPHPPETLAYPPLGYVLVDDANDDARAAGTVNDGADRVAGGAGGADDDGGLGIVQQLRIANFPLHEIERIPEDGQWLVTNENVTIVSTDKEGTLTYTGRNFQG